MGRYADGITNDRSYIQNAIDIKNEELLNLQNHLKTVQKKSETGSATKYEILTTQVKISTIESQKYDLEAARARGR